MTIRLSTERREALEAARAMGVLTVEDRGRRITYRSLEEIDRILAADDAAAASSSSTRVNYTIARFCRAG